MKRAWWKEAVVYQIYPRSFADCNGDGYGDCRGIMEHLDYLKDLGVNVLWLCPVYRSPMDDNGYDISDYYDINPEFGTLEEFRKLLHAVHARGMKLIMDLVVNHTSDDHPWFLESRKSKDNPYRDFYIWRDGKNENPPSDWGSYFSGPAWQYDDTTGQYYLHLFSKKQPDLNWENPAVRAEIYRMMRWWCDLGIDGFRMDTVNMYSKAHGFPNTGKKNSLAKQYFIDGPAIHDYLQEMHREVLTRYDIMTVGEAPDIPPEKALAYVEESRNELGMIFQFEHMRLDRAAEGKFAEIMRCSPLALKKTLTRWQTALDGHGWNSLYLTNHDQPRQVSRFGDSGEFRVQSAKLLATMLHTMQGTPYIFEGEELGMTNCPFELDDLKDIEALNYIAEFKQRGGHPKTKLPEIRWAARDNARTPMQWNSRENAGFTSGKPWIIINPNYIQINVEAQLADPDSVYHYYKKLISLRHRMDVFVYGDFCDEDSGHPQVYCYTRNIEHEALLVVLNMGDSDMEYRVRETVAGRWEPLIGNYELTPFRCVLHLLPWQAIVFHKTDIH